MDFSGPEFRVNLQKRLDQFLLKHKDLPKQGSDEWKKSRETCIGGSEMQQVIGRGVKTFISRKTGIIRDDFCGNTATRFGKLFENVTHLMMELFFKTKVYETGSVPSWIEGLRYSPDGLAIVDYVCQAENDKGQEAYVVLPLITLFEFKSPLVTVPQGQVPTRYVPQICTGLAALPIVDIGIFVNNVYRKCAFEDLDSDLYDTNFHTKAEYLVQQLAKGVIYFERHSGCKLTTDYGAQYAPFEQLLRDYDSGLVSIKKIEMVFGDWDALPSVKQQNEIREMYGLNRWEPQDSELSEPDFNDPQLEILPWKLIKSDLIIINKDEDWLDEHYERIENTVECIKLINSVDGFNKKYDTMLQLIDHFSL